jgi:drug/metabolite transporter (DMT)-like permease
MSQSDDRPARAPVVFLFGLCVVLVSLAAFVADLVTGHDVVRSLAANAAGVAVLVGWAAYDTLVDPTSRVTSRGGAAGTGVLLCGLYLVAVGVVVAATSVVHGRLELAAWAGGLGVALVAVGFLAFPSETVVEGGVGDEAMSDERAAEDGGDV